MATTTDAAQPADVRPRPAAARTAGRVLVLLAGVCVTVPTLLVARGLVGYDRFSYRRHGALIRQMAPRRAAAATAPLLPCSALAVGWLGDRFGGGALVRLALVAAGLALAEIYSTCLHREAWIAAFEPWHLRPRVCPLGGPPRHPEDRRLHHLLRTQINYGVAPLVVAGTLPVHSPIAVTVVAGAFAAKFVGQGAVDYEVCFHWHLHCRVLEVAGCPRLSRLWDLVAEWVLGPLYGYVPKVYRVEHLLIHHPENSGPRDLHTPLPYDRTSLLEFCVFAVRAFPAHLLGWGIASHHRCRAATRRAVRAGVAGYWVLLPLTMATGRLLGVWLVMMVVHRAVTATRSQHVWHGLIDPDRPRDPAASTILWVRGAAGWHELADGDGDNSQAIVPASGTDWAFFDNHHLLHHLCPRAHYTEFPRLLARRAPGLRESGATVLDLAGLPTFVQDCWGRRLDRLGAIVLNGPAELDRTEFLHRRLAPAPDLRTPYAELCARPVIAALDTQLARFVRVLTGGQ